MITKDKISEIIKKIVINYNPEKIILFGSYASESPNENSDLDIFIIKDSDLPRPKRVVNLRKLLSGYLVPMDIIIYTPKEIEESKKRKFDFVNEVLSTGKILYDRTC